MASWGSPEIARRRLGLALRELRKNLDLTCDAVGSKFERSGSWVSRIEGGRQGLRVRDLNDFLDIYQVTDHGFRRELEELAQASRKRGWWSKFSELLTEKYVGYIGLEAEAKELHLYEALVVHGLLQTEAYARATFHLQSVVSDDKPEDIERKIKVRLNRQELLHKEDPLKLWVILDESVLRRVIGSREIMREQLDHLARLAHEHPGITVQVVPLADSTHPGMLSSFTILKFAEPDPDMIYIESLTSDVYEDGENAKRYRLVFDNLRAAALSPAASIELIEEIRDGLATNT